jgi:hypothetical protein
LAFGFHDSSLRPSTSSAARRLRFALDMLGEAVARTTVDEFLRRYEVSRAARR